MISKTIPHFERHNFFMQGFLRTKKSQRIKPIGTGVGLVCRKDNLWGAVRKIILCEEIKKARV